MITVSTRSLALVLATLAAACAAVDDKSPVEPRAPREYRTGSNIPVRESRPATEEERARTAEQMSELQRGGAAVRP
jgi:hypothetical protein